jgi:hypothetical protein
MNSKDIYKQVNEFKEEMNKLTKLKEFKQNSEIKKTIENIKSELNKDTEILKNKQIAILQMKSSIFQIKTLNKSQANRGKLVENRVSGMEDKV